MMAGKGWRGSWRRRGTEKLEDHEHSAPVKEEEREREREREGENWEEANREGERETDRDRKREVNRVVITAESFCRGIFQNDWAL